VVYVAAMRYAVYPAFSRILRYVNERVRLAGADVSLILVFTFLSAAATEAIGIHAVFGAFVMGLLVRQVPRVREASLHSIETFVLSALSPVFFAFVGLKVNLWSLTGWQLPALVIGVAVAGKLFGCYGGARMGGLGRWESLAIGFGMNARGAMELVVALIGLSLGLLTPAMYSTIVLVAVVTSFLAPVLLRLVMPKLVLTDDERRRMSDTGRSQLLPPGPVRILAPTAGGPNAESMLAIAAPLVSATGGALVALYVERPPRGGLWAFLSAMVRPSLAGRGLDAQLDRAAARMGAHRRLFSSKRVRSGDPAAATLTEAARDYDLLMLGATAHRMAAGSVTGRILADVDLPAIVVRAAHDSPPATFARVLVPLDGGLVSRAAAELAFLYARSVGASVTLAYVVNEARVATGALVLPESRESHALGGTSIEARIRSEFAGQAEDGATALDVRVLASGDPASTIIELAGSGGFDLLVLGAESRTFVEPFLFGLGTAEILDHAECTVAVAVPRIKGG
jgi:nucleotide-binding universal stress UspA family protein